jgi:hypothetical protein
LFSDDDIYEPDFLKTLTSLSLEHPHVDLFHSRVAQINKNGGLVNISPSLPEYENIIDFLISRFVNRRIQFALDFMVRTNALRDIGGFFKTPLAWGADDITWFTIAKDAGIVHTNKILCKWRISDINLSTTGNPQLKLLAIDNYKNWFSEFSNLLRSQYEDDCKYLFLKKHSENWFYHQRMNVLRTYKDSNGISKTLFKFLFRTKTDLPFRNILFHSIKS